MLRVAVLADTHIPKRAKTLPHDAWKIVRSSDVIIHAGDVLTRELVDELQTIAPTYIVRGNNDTELQWLPNSISFELEQVTFGLIHDSGAVKGRGHRMRCRFPECDVVVFGHSHVPVNECTDGQLLFNPGSPTDRRKQPYCTMGILHVDGSRVYGEILRC